MQGRGVQARAQASINNSLTSLENFPELKYADGLAYAFKQGTFMLYSSGCFKKQKNIHDFNFTLEFRAF